MKGLRRKPTDAELGILRVLWARGPSTVREVTETLGRDTGYTTVLKLLQIMTDKGLVTRDASARPHVYRAAESQAAILRRMVSDLVERAFGGSTVGLVLHALSGTPTTSHELDQIRRLLDEMLDKRRGSVCP